MKERNQEYNIKNTFFNNLVTESLREESDLGSFSRPRIFFLIKI